MYNSPIKTGLMYRELVKEVNKDTDEQIYKAVVACGVDVDRDELLRALRYDREQYDAGFTAGYRAATPKWIPVTERLPGDEGAVLVRGRRGGIYTAEFRMFGDFGEVYRHWHKLNSKNHRCEPTHWMPLPPEPKEDGRDD